jgi:hypothetical protein
MFAGSFRGFCWEEMLFFAVFFFFFNGFGFGNCCESFAGSFDGEGGWNSNAEQASLFLPLLFGGGDVVDAITFSG